MVTTRARSRRALAPVTDSSRGVNTTPAAPRTRKPKKVTAVKRGDEKVLLFASPAKSRSPADRRQDAAASPPVAPPAAAATEIADAQDDSFGTASTPSLSGVVVDNDGGDSGIFRASISDLGIPVGRCLTESYDSHDDSRDAVSSAEARRFRSEAVIMMREGNLSTVVDGDELLRMLEQSKSSDSHEAALDEAPDSDGAACDSDVDYDEEESAASSVSRSDGAACASDGDYDEEESASSSSAASSEYAPWSLDDFAIVDTLGKGGTATVYHAVEQESGRHVALKIMPVRKSEDYDDAMNEISIHEELDHPRIIELADHFFTDGGVEDDEDDDDDSAASCPAHESLVMILELSRGESLFDIIRDAPKGRLSEPRAQRCFRDMISAVNHLHSRRIVHSDIKSLNFLSDDGAGNEVKLCDFGMSVRLDGDAEIVGGSPSYMAPEHLLAYFDAGRTRSFDGRVDVYSLGAVLFEMLAGRLPYRVVDGEKDEASLAAELDGLTLREAASKPRLIDVRDMAAFVEKVEAGRALPPLVFPDHVSPAARDLIGRLMQDRADERISLDEATEHPWLAPPSDGAPSCEGVDA